MGRLVAYCSDQAHSPVEKAGLIVKMRYVECDENYSMCGSAFQEIISQDRAAILGATSSCAFDDLQIIGRIFVRTVYMASHVDAAYTGTAFVCPEFREWLRGVKMANTFAFNPSKRTIVHFDCMAMW
ncbi:histidine decarboxylase-like [Tropilaelaps mercedesae]|uniref:Histidine decarboxylase n=1 Tax=Tropilaelaps mercedesae TaxID=418985 RepID=A0A1V9Y3Z4_9ACAR|nr:histidine decarboxylase-like [Tropilaelaps mercedesae]